MKTPVALIASAMAVSLALTGAGLPDAEETQAVEASARIDAAASSLALPTATVELSPEASGEEFSYDTDGGEVTVGPEAQDAAVAIEAPSGEGVSIGLPTTAENGDAQSPDGETVIYPGGPGVADVSVQAEEDGSVRSHTVISDGTTTQRFPYTVDTETPSVPHLLPNGAVAFLSPGVSPSTATDADVIGVIDTPWSVDASGAPVATHFEIEGDTVVQVVEHQQAGVSYPVVSDPWFIPVLALLARGGMAAWKAAKVVRFYKVGTIVAGRYTTAGGFRSFSAFKSRYGSRSGYDWHHIVEQKHVGRFDARAVHNPNNLVQIPRNIHQKCVNSIMGSKNVSGPGFTAARGKTMRQTVDSYGSWAQMHRVGAAILRYCGVGV